MAVTKLIPGFRFHPTGVELVMYFLKRKVMGKKFHDDVIAELDIYKYSPWDLPDKSCLKTGDLEWYFFCPIEKKYGSGMRMNRATEIGFWKATGKDRAVLQSNHTVGMIKTLIFHTGKAPLGYRTNWVMHEYRLEDKDLADKGIPQDSYVICKVFQKEGPGPRNGAQYGRPFNEEDWNDENLNDGVGIPFAESTALVPILPVISNGSVPNDLNLHASGCSGSTSMSCLSGLLPSPDPDNPSHPSNQAVNDDDGDILSMLDIFNEDDNILPKEADISSQANIAAGAPSNDFIEDDIPGQANIAADAPSNDFFEDLGDLDHWTAIGNVTTGDVLGCDWDGLSSSQNASTNGMVTTGDVLGCNWDFLEMNDLDPPLFWQNTQPGSWSQDN